MSSTSGTMVSLSEEQLESDGTEYEYDSASDDASSWWNSSYYRDWSRDVTQRFNVVVAESEEQEENSIFRWCYAPDFMLLPWTIEPGMSPDSVVSVSGTRSRLWYDRQHWYRVPVSGEPRSEIPRQYLMPWEKYGSQDGLCYDIPAAEDERSVAVGISFPRLELNSNFRLFLLQPHHGDLDSPVSGYLVVSILFLHSCYFAVRHSRGNPGIRGNMILDGKPIRISKNLETFLRFIRRTDQVIAIWVRELCVKKTELSLQVQRLVENCSCGVLRMDRVMEAADDNGLLHYHEKLRRPKLWNDVDTSTDEPYHRPVDLRPKELLEIGYDLTYDQIGCLEAYTYVPLDLTVQEIRLLTLYSAENVSDPIVVDMNHAPLHGGVGYLALSYTWGSKMTDQYIRAGSGKLQITANLDRALRHMRSWLERGKIHTIWIDALCIDQNNDREKMRQIPRMQEIFENADGVFCWLGETTEISSNTIDFLVELHKEEITIFETDDNGEATQTLKQTERLAEAWAQLYMFLKARYFSRKWVVQEVASASVPTMLLGGNHADSWYRVFNSAKLMSRHFDQIFKIWQRFEHPIILENEELKVMTNPGCWDIGFDDVEYHMSLIETITYMRELRKSGAKPSLLLLLLLTQNSDCIEAQDQLYSLWGLAGDSQDLFSKLAYSSTTAELYTSFAKSYAKSTRSLDIICASQLPAAGNTMTRWVTTTRGTQGSAPDLKIPSWCPDWRQSYSVSSLVRQLLLFDDWNGEKARLDIDFPPYHADSFERKICGENNTKIAEGQTSTSPNLSDSLPVMPFSFDGSVLIASGVIIDTITHVSEWNEDNYSPSILPEKWRQEAEQHCYGDGVQVPKSEVFERCANMWIGEATGAVKFEWIEKVSDEFGGTTNKYKVTPICEEMIERLWNVELPKRRAKMIKGRRFVVTSRGRIGLAPWHVRSGFKLAILLGCSVPVLLEELDKSEAAARREGSFYNKHTGERLTQSLEDTVPGLYFRGDCYVQDCMEGQLIQPFGSNTIEAWNKIRRLPRLRIH